MTSNMDRVREFHDTYGCTSDADDSPGLREIRAKLILEEAIEVGEALIGAEPAYDAMLYIIEHRTGHNLPQPLEAVAKELADLSMTKDGTALALRIDLEEAERRVHAANMTKTRQPTPAGQTKVLKGPDYRPPDMTGVVRRPEPADELSPGSRAALQVYHDEYPYGML